MANTKSSTPFFSQDRPIRQVALYARVSTLHGQQDPEMQLSELREYAGRRGLTIYQEYVDEGVSGSKESRPALNQLISDARRCRFDAVLVWKIDRFGRSLKHLVNSLADLSAWGIAFVSLRDNLDLSTPSGRLMFQIIGAMAEFERALIQERVRAGLRNAKAKGKQIGRPKVKVDSAEMLKLRTEGLSWRAIADRLQLGLGTVYRACNLTEPELESHKSSVEW
jgi:DNA invertase Pin-like site-specific DNA recombinase